MQNQVLEEILNYLKSKRGFDFSGYRESMLSRRIDKRIFKKKCSNESDYFEYLKNDDTEIDKLIDVFTINVSKFFRNSLAFEYIGNVIIPELFAAKLKNGNNNLRIWSSACACGEEPYSIAILVNEFLLNESASIQVNIFATDIDKKALKGASVGSFPLERIENVKYGFLSRYFTNVGSRFKINDEIKKMVHFSFHDLISKNMVSPQYSIFGGFDIILCRNVLIYMELENQKLVFENLYKSLNKNGILILGEAEEPIEGFKHYFEKVIDHSKIYRKIR